MSGDFGSKLLRRAVSRRRPRPVHGREAKVKVGKQRQRWEAGCSSHAKFFLKQVSNVSTFEPQQWSDDITKGQAGWERTVHCG